MAIKCSTIEVFTCERESKQETETPLNPETGDGDAIQDGKEKILTHALSHNDKYYAICDDFKKLRLYATHPEWKKISSRSVARRATAIVFTHDLSQVLVADKSGDVYSFSLTDLNKPGELLCGHLSMLLDMAITSNGRYIITADRDEKIRVGHYPNAYNIAGFCLGHEEFVSKLLILKDDILVSGAGDGTVRFWNLETFQELYCLDCAQDLPSEMHSSENTQVAVKAMQFFTKYDILAVAADSYPVILFYKVVWSAGNVVVEKVNTMRLSQPPWDMQLQGDILWVLQPVEGDTIVPYSVSYKQEDFQVEKTSDKKTIELAETVNKNWDFFKGSVGQESNFQLLFKAYKNRKDNMQDYLERKRQRLAQTPLKKEKQSRRNKQRRRKEKEGDAAEKEGSEDVEGGTNSDSIAEPEPKILKAS
ncbi:tRNA (guanine-N(7)-)-methyltransferase non-catalytic subunit wdr4 isoform X2 [Lingula anatina]|uniref:tRNA (guanine-N(7)-)-methyltransferase non-catalytic subunit n=1 Tax=Lingula anatina TaxID=7574 RepID=A0A1S3J3M4_LINAN|nr:tRNA (guanine-N(7)-)-methyltransferase non-catalytic subunit wdr4 isoform X2 [Lingula anatina]|eukprot:XP_013405000.1 tRNA (guanine-N(7)-)-methyltransferase non-catalytic subunit wdr4 isoform X2 [Lingula anatina]